MYHFVPTMKPLNDVNKGNDVKNQPVEEMNAEPKKIDFSKVKIEPLLLVAPAMLTGPQIIGAYLFIY